MKKIYEKERNILNNQENQENLRSLEDIEEDLKKGGHVDVTAGYSAPANSNTRQGTDGYVIASTSTHQASDPDYQTLPNPDTSTSTFSGDPSNPNPNYAGGEGYGSACGRSTNRLDCREYRRDGPY